ncbi:TonB-dependent receptor [Fulvivirga sp. 29W222]|uniref:TonB-dependent receptor n=1 Tax=Fulvivirga marina TaxID=2494733 RepID=A0A937KC15_9BACT|nr:TonB-dependent receptor [Fulvivirga marina]MBL6447017.1 TonB-dependent receptor [Fulvivirga marina]
MSYLRFILMTSLVGFLVQHVTAQEDTTALILDAVNIQGSRLDKFTIGEKVEKISSIHRESTAYSSLSELLFNFSGANIRSYGVSGLSTPSVRGTGSNHTAVFWEGVNLQSPTNGSLDLTLMPVSFVDDVSLQYGGAGSLFGSGTLGGAIHLGTAVAISEGFSGKFFQQLGSFGSTYTGANINWRHQRVRLSLRGFVNHADNDFTYYNRYTVRDEEQKNASIDQQGVLSELYYQLTDNSDITFKYWYQDNLVHIPDPASAGGNTKATQADEFHRVVLKWKNQSANRMLRGQSALVLHHLEYDDKITDVSNTQSLSWISEFEATYKLGKSTWLDAGINNTYDRAEVASYGDEIPLRNQTGLYISSKKLIAEKLEVNLGLRETLSSGDLSPIMPSLGLNYALTNDFSLKSKVARSYRIPTFNDLYWKGAGAMGNPDLEPELGWSAEIGVLSEKEFDRSRLSLEVTGFSNTISQWIQWVEVESVWSPVNVQKIWARGVELGLKYGYQLSDDWKLQTWSNYSLTKSTKQEVGNGGSIQELDKQVTYTPLHQAKAAVNLVHNRFAFGINQIYVGEQYITGDNRRTLDAYVVTGVSASCQFLLSQKHSFKISGQVKNVFDKDYEARNARPMPGRNYHLSIIYQFN